MADGTHILIEPETVTTPVVFASPHSGRAYPADFLRDSILDEHSIRSSEDAFMDELLRDVPTKGAPVLLARVPRAYVDLNRGEDELDPALILNITRPSHNPRVASGLGVIPRVVANGRAIYRGKITAAQVRARLAAYWHPYHRALQEVLDQQRARFGQAVLIDMHSMPHEAIEAVRKPGQKRPDVVLGDRFGAAAAPEVVQEIEAAFVAQGLHVVRNTPFAGAYITQRYGRPARGQSVVQVEINRSLYMDEAKLCLDARFEPFRAALNMVFDQIIEIGQQKVPLAAE